MPAFAAEDEPMILALVVAVGRAAPRSNAEGSYIDASRPSNHRTALKVMSWGQDGHPAICPVVIPLVQLYPRLLMVDTSTPTSRLMRS
jgi:ACR3 family arsenite efflux pump ArsB